MQVVFYCAYLIVNLKNVCMKKLMCTEAKQIDMVEYLASLGHHPQKVRNQDYWYLSPLREETVASFKVNRRLNVWFDQGTGKGGDLIDFGTLYFNCSVSDLLQRLSQYHPGPAFSFHPHSGSGDRRQSAASFAGEKKDTPDNKIVVLDTRPLAEQSLLNYLQKRSIPLEIATRFCREVDFLLYGKQHTVIGFQNKAGGYELRNEYFKGSSSPKDITFIDNRTEQVAVFEGFFSFLSLQTINSNKQAPLSNCLVLNSLSFLEKCRPLMEQYKQVHLILDRDNAGRNRTRLALEWDASKYIDRSDFYHGHKDLNDWLVHLYHSQSIGPRMGKRL
ncbi:toprim domain-containing protein [Chitinophaga japonensis]